MIWKYTYNLNIPTAESKIRLGVFLSCKKLNIDTSLLVKLKYFIY